MAKQKVMSVNDVVEQFGGMARFCAIMCVTKEAVWGWRTRGGIPPQQALWIEALTDGAVKSETIAMTERKNLRNDTISPEMFAAREHHLHQLAGQLTRHAQALGRARTALQATV